ncbi:hypothetical protein KSS93_15195 [Pseudomonas xanthosomatis]|uniref:hypothetical protein n=1 Tax=Pseudomonas xanthosomatis TaxID=2842356 RepID=UPI001C3E15E4|nr:hypothetical protein [Pseudomonas xanthosomatis]QXH44242.1 hypothetical protein KSS93_15195 [Pseudomonas xanthosomatis]
MELFEKFELSTQGIGYGGSHLSVDSKYETGVGSKAEPFYIHTDSDTDWAGLSPSIAGVVVAIIVAWLTVRVQKNQIKANLSTFRSQWMTDLRVCASEYLMVMLDMAVMTEKDPKFRSSRQHYEGYRQLMSLGAKFDLLLTGEEDDAKALRDIENKTSTIILAMKSGEDSQPAIDSINNFKDLLRVKLHVTWCEIKRDVGETTQ